MSAPAKPAPRAPGRPRAARLLVAAGAIAAIALGLRFAAPRLAAKPAGTAPPSAAALAESVRVAEAARDWARVLSHVERLAALEPRSAKYRLGLGVAWNNYAWAGGRSERSGARTSLERAEFQRLAFQHLDSAAALARGEQEIALIRVMRGQMYEALGLPLDALAQYQDALRHAPGDRLTAARAARIAARLRESGGGLAPER
jgi:tetratricopeptide (TPR) repeat protein